MSHVASRHGIFSLTHRTENESRPISVNLMEGGVPIVIDGKIAGGIGMSGDYSEHDAQTAQAGADAVIEA